VKLTTADAERASLRIAPKDDAPLSAGAAQIEPKAFQVTYERVDRGFRLSWEAEASHANIGTLIADVTPDGVRLGWNAGPPEEARFTADRMREAVLSADPFARGEYGDQVSDRCRGRPFITSPSGRAPSSQP
jgi:hypothetical protein